MIVYMVLHRHTYEYSQKNINISSFFSAFFSQRPLENKNIESVNIQSRPSKL